MHAMTAVGRNPTAEAWAAFGQERSFAQRENYRKGYFKTYDPLIEVIDEPLTIDAIVIEQLQDYRRAV